MKLKSVNIFMLLTLASLIGCIEKGVVTESSDNKLSETKDEALPCNFETIDLNTRAPQDINQVTDLINALPKPLDLPCFITSLERPLKVNLTLSRASVQTAVGRNSPRVFIFSNKLVLAVAPEGSGSKLLEVSFMYTDDSSLKAEYEFPITETIDYQHPFDRVANDPAVNGVGTSCQGCHSGEALDTTVRETNAFTSVALKPASNMSLLSFTIEFNKCELSDAKDYRCRMIRALFAGDDLDSVDFPTATPEWIDTL